MAAPPGAPGRLSTPQRIRDRLAPDGAALSDPLLEDLITEQQALVEARARRAYAPGDAGYDLACSATTNLAAAMALVRARSDLAGSADFRLGKLDVSKRTQLQAWTKLIEHLRFTAGEALSILERDARARRFTFINGRDA